MRRHQPAKHSEPSPHLEKLLEAANSASQTVAALHVAFMAFAAYLGVIIWGTTHEDLLRISPVKLPILDVDLPLTTFYGGTPWLMILLHFNLLMQLELLSRKLWNLDSELPNTLASQQIRDRLFIFPFTHLIAGRSSVRLIRWLLSLVVGITVIALPLFLLLAAQIRFLPFHDEGITWSQRIAVWIDAIMLLGLWPLIASSNDSARQWWRNLSYRLFGYWLIWLRALLTGGWNRLARMTNLHKITPSSIPTIGAEAKGMVVLLTSVLVVFPLSIIAVIPGNITVEIYYQPQKDSQIYFEDWLIRNIFKKWLSVANIEGTVRICRPLIPMPPYKQPDQKQQLMLTPTCEWFDLGGLPRNLDLQEAQLVPKEVSISLLTRALDPDKSVRDSAFKEFEGLKLKDRDLRFANLSEAIMPKADLRNVKLQGAVLSYAKLQSSDLSYAKLQSAELSFAKLQGAVLGAAELQGADLSAAELQGAVLSGAELLGINWLRANLDTIFVFNNLMSAWDTQQKEKLESVFKPLLNENKFKRFQQQMVRATNKILPEQPASQIGCYSDNPKLLECNYNQPTQLDTYRSALHPKLIDLACSDPAIAKGIARRAYQWSGSQNASDFGLAAAILNVLDTPKPCKGLAALPEKIRQLLRETAEERKK